MVGKSLMQSAALAVLAAVGAIAVPAQAQDGEDNDRRGHGGGYERRAEAVEQRRQQVEVRAQAQVEAPQGGGWQSRRQEGQDGGGRQARQQQAEPEDNSAREARVAARHEARAQQQRVAPEDGWRSQRAPEGQRYGRNWDNTGAVGRPAPAYNGATPPVPQRGTAEGSRGWRGEGNDGQWSQHNRTYSDPDRSGGYRGDRDRQAQDWRDLQGDRNNTYRDGHRADNDRDRRDQTYAYRNGYASRSHDHRRWDHNDWRRDNRYNWSGYRNQHRDLYRAGRYYSPYNNYSYNRLSIGFFLNNLFYSDRYWINDPWQYRLPEVYGPYRWVRYYDDVLLVDIYSGEVVDVIHDFFW